MKQRPRIEKICFVLLVVTAVYVTQLLILRITYAPTKKEQQSLATKSSSISMSISRKQIRSQECEPIICDRSHDNYDYCMINHPSILDPSTSTFFTIGLSPLTSSIPQLTHKIRPYPRKWEKFTMSKVNEITLTTSSTNKTCKVYHQGPALVFSIGGYTGNFFHDFNDGIIPLYVTIETLLSNQNVTLVISNYKNWWYSKYAILLKSFTKNRIVNLDNQTNTHCFPSVVVGLISHGPMSIQANHNFSFLKFRSLLDIAYTKCRGTSPPPLKTSKPRLVLMGRRGKVGRVILNQNKIIGAMKLIGFDVVLFRPNKFTNLCDAYKLINGSHGMIGVHGAALTHSLFLRPGAVLVQVVPIGIQWLADSYFKSSAMGLRLQYVEYKISTKESSLAEKYGSSHIILRNPKKYIRGNWSAVDSIYLKGQDVRLDVNRLRKYLVLAYSKAKRFMDNNG